MLKNLAALGMENVEHAHSITRLNQLLRSDYRGLIVSTIHKFRDMPADLNPRRNIYETMSSCWSMKPIAPRAAIWATT